MAYVSLFTTNSTAGSLNASLVSELSETRGIRISYSFLAFTMPFLYSFSLSYETRPATNIF
jgi:hypothetical protein